MPKLKKADLANVRYVSMSDYYQKVDQYEDINDKIKFTARYLATHGGKDNPDYSIDKAIHLAKVKIVDASIKKHEEYKKQNKNAKVADHIVDPTSKNDKVAEMFLGNPVDFIKGEAEKVVSEVNSTNIAIPEEKSLKESCIRTINSMTLQVRDNIKALDKKSTTLDVMARMEARFGGKAGLEKAYNATRGSFMSRLFGTSSAAAKNLDAAYKSFNNPNNVYYGDIDTMGKAAVQYIQHNFPDWKQGREFPTEADMENLSDTEKERMKFSINMVKSLEEQLDLEDNMEQLVQACEQQDIKYSDTEIVEEKKVINLDDSSDDLIDDDEEEKEEEKLIESEKENKDSSIDQEEFRNQLKEDLKEDEEYEFEEKEDEKELDMEKEEQIDDLNNSY